jgi:uncharacterized membrane protein
MRKNIPMASPASVAKHPVHPMLIVFPVGLWIFSFVSDLVFLFGGSPVWGTDALYAMGGGETVDFGRD